MAFRVASGYEPQRADIRLALGLPALALAPVCPSCGLPHTPKRFRHRPPVVRKDARRRKLRHSEAWREACVMMYDRKGYHD